MGGRAASRGTGAMQGGEGEAMEQAGAEVPRLPVQAMWPPWRAAWILHEDEDLLVVDKPFGTSTHAQEPDRVDDAVSRLRAWLRARGDAEAYLGIHQRLDRDTSGVLLFTRRKEANPAMARQFEGRSVEKVYLAAVAGLGDRQVPRTLRHRLVPGEGGAMRALPPGRGPGQEAVTHARVLERRGDRALLELRPETGRTHQIRVQLAAEGFPIAGDVLYGGPPAARLLLHAAALSIKHPATGKAVTFRAPPPDALAAWLAPGPINPYEDPEAIARALAEAADRRYGIAHAGDTTAFRLAHGGGDGLPGVSVDVYGEHLVVSLFSEEAERAREAILDAAFRLGAAPAYRVSATSDDPPLVRGVYLKNRPRHASVIVDPRQDTYAPRHAVRGESAPEAFTVLESGLPFQVRLGEGLSTGIFLDQRENRRRVRAFAGGARVLNLFAYTGAFTVAAVAGGARASVTVDVARAALAWARENLDAIGADPAAHVIVEADVFPWLRAAARAGERFDLVLLDPPSFATTKKSRFSAEADYGKLAALVMQLLAPGGRLLACTNHRGISRAAFRRRLHEAAREAGCALAQLKDLPDPVDFPPEPGADPHLKSVLATAAYSADRAQGKAPGKAPDAPPHKPARAPTPRSSPTPQRLRRGRR